MKIVESRFLRGPNVHSPYPCFHCVLDLEDLDEIPSSAIPGFVERLLQMLPSLQSHCCGLGYPGGFVDRLQEGTYMAHVTEHVLIELQCLAGADVRFGQARQVHGRPRCYRIICAYEVERVVEAALPVAIALVEAAVRGETVDLATALDPLKELHERHALGPSTRALVEAARDRGIPTRRLSEENSLVQLGFGCRQQRISASVTGRTSAIGVDIASDKALTKRLLAEAGLPVPEGRVVRTAHEAREAFATLGPPVVVKPLDANHGRGVTPRVGDLAALTVAFERAVEHSRLVLVERHVTGADYRVLIVNGRMVAAARRRVPSVCGDGHSTVRELIEALNADPRRGQGHCKAMTRVPLDDALEEVLLRQGCSLETVLPAGTEALLRDNGNLSTGGTAEDVTQQVRPEIAEACVRAALTVGLDVAGIDVICRDIAQPLEEQGGAIIEVNAAPGLRMHEAPGRGQSRRVARAIIDGLFPPGDRGRIPIVAVTGTNGKTTTTLAISHVLQEAGYRVGTTTTQGIYLNGRLLQEGDCAGYWSALTVLQDRRVEAAVLETARGGILRRGLAFDSCDVGVVLNVSDDHLGQDGIDSLEQLARVKAVVAEAASRAAVLNADDEQCLRMRDECRRRTPLWLLSMDSWNPELRRHLARRGSAVYLDRDCIVLAHDGRREAVVSVQRLPFAWYGHAPFNVANALAAVASTAALGCRPFLIGDALTRFVSDAVRNPLRMNLYSLDGLPVIVDYAHNPSSYRALIETARSLGRGRVIGVVTAPGDRRDHELEEVGRICGGGFDRLFVFEMEDRRGRPAGDVAERLAAAARAAAPDRRVEVVLEVQEALARAATCCRGEDLLVFGCASDLGEFGNLRSRLSALSPEAFLERTVARISTLPVHHRVAGRRPVAVRDGRWRWPGPPSGAVR